MNTVCAYFYRSWISGRGCRVRRAYPLTTDLNMSMRSENFKFLCERRSKTLNITAYYYPYIEFCKCRWCRRSGPILPAPQKHWFRPARIGSRRCERRISSTISESEGILIWWGGVSLFFFGRGRRCFWFRWGTSAEVGWLRCRQLCRGRGLFWVQGWSWGRRVGRKKGLKCCPSRKIIIEQIKNYLPAIISIIYPQYMKLIKRSLTLNRKL